ncbi:hypothetical protein ADL06_14965 [Streptomyces sp. NRRL F-6491]|nr:hypothetical protein ADL06_14965 [Streptomyces sp. NRRL F-6491]KOX44859.1 hypothetical protein ADL08_14075 [Streptomyces sp. NRRL F-6492]
MPVRRMRGGAGPVRGEEGQHPDIVGVAIAGEGAADDPGEMKVSGGDGVGGAIAALEDSGGGPGADAGDRLRTGGDLFEAGDHAGSGHDRAGSLLVDAGFVPVPGGDAARVRGSGMT